MTLDLNAGQEANGRGIITAVKRLTTLTEADRRQVAAIAIVTALTESGMRMIASANVPESQKYPHIWWDGSGDGLGHDHASCGMFQQQTGYAWTPAGFGRAMNQTTMDSPNGWGTPAELMNAELSTGKFLGALLDRGWQGIPGWVAAQNVQGSAYDGTPRKANNFSNVYGGNYAGQWQRATQIVDSLWAAESPHAIDAHELEEEMKGYLATDGTGNHWVIAYDLSSKRQVTLAAAKGLYATGKYDKNPGFDQTTLSRIPVTK